MKSEKIKFENNKVEGIVRWVGEIEKSQDDVEYIKIGIFNKKISMDLIYVSMFENHTKYNSLKKKLESIKGKIIKFEYIRTKQVGKKTYYNTTKLTTFKISAEPKKVVKMHPIFSKKSTSVKTELKNQ